MYVKLVIEKIASLHQMSAKDTAVITTNNAARLFLW
ncbi:MAG: hypothetical protein N2D54_05685 [Chloroflexota bacterium]